jgi:UPF0755 protein
MTAANARGPHRTKVVLLALALVAGTGAAATTALWPLVTTLTESDDYTGAGRGAVSVTVHVGDPSRAIGAALDKAGAVKTARAFNAAAKDNPKSGSIQPGIYSLHLQMSAAAALKMLLDPVNRTVPRVTIREGLWTSEIIKTLSAESGRPLADYALAIREPDLLGLPVQAGGDPQGYLFPSTYEFAPDATAAEQLGTMVDKSLQELGNLGVSPARAQRFLTVASIVEAEARARPDGPKVARVIENRLAKQIPLQMDSTVHFISRSRGKASTTDDKRRSLSRYNTYRVKGLPPGPIDNPGLWAMQAAVHPTKGKWLYFVTVNPTTGATLFSVDAAGQAANVKVFQKWCSSHPSQC